MPPAKVEPGRDPEMAERTQKLNVVFALTSIGLLLAFSWMVWADYNREWKKYQIEFNRARGQAHPGADRAGPRQGGRGPAARQLEAQLAQGEQEDGGPPAGDRRRRRSELEQAQRRVVPRRPGLPLHQGRDRRGPLRLRGGRPPAESSAEARRRHLDDLEKQLGRAAAGARGRRGRSATAAQARLARPGEDAPRRRRRRRRSCSPSRRGCEDRLHKIQPGFVSFVRNLPVLDLANPSLKVNQIMPANLKDDVIFTSTPKVDRCTTCHLGIDKKGYENAPQPFTHPPQHGAVPAGPAPDGEGRLHGLPPGPRPGHRLRQRRPHRRPPPSRRRRGASTAAASTYHGAALLGPADDGQGPHRVPVREVPPGRGRGAEGRPAQHRASCWSSGTAATAATRSRAGRACARSAPTSPRSRARPTRSGSTAGSRSPRRFRPTRMPQVWDVRLDETDGAEGAQRRRGQRGGRLPRGQRRSRETYPAPPAGDLAAGPQDVRDRGLPGLPPGRRRQARASSSFDAASFRTHGPNLDGTGSKVNAGWLYSWVQTPRATGTRRGCRTCGSRDKEAADITAYLMSLKNDALPRPAAARPRPARPRRDRARAPAGRQRAREAGGREARGHGRPPAHALPGREDDRAATAASAATTIAGFEKTSPIGVELTEEGSKLVERLDFGFEHGKIPHTLPGWVHRKVRSRASSTGAR